MSKIPKDIDERSRRTRNRIAHAVIHLAVRQPLDTITIKQLVQEAGISRSTFYAHYTGLGDYLNRSYAWVLERGVQVSAAQSGHEEQALPVRAILDHMAARSDYAMATLDSSYRPAMVAAGEERLRNVAATNLRRLRPELDENERQSLAIFIAGAFSSTIRSWTRAGMRESPASVQSRFERHCAALLAPQSVEPTVQGTIGSNTALAVAPPR